ncbi:two-component system sensor histidine kinase EnvZ [Aliikangiella marina]|uniref:histidine kinase n=1 Tax=Aliikangiella marina TaxID=1712262 RepID=A0A545T990_9GAMM|nr:two-component system sensor histidine kinase EnvZ [Aliikangiella marina]TQV73765.1 two-component system sensor histidine kinase EnvZ [Aliikangiella marina]
MKIFPHSFFGRNTLMIATLLVISHVISYFTIQHFVVDRHNRTVMYLASNQVKLFYMGGKADIPKSLALGFSQATQLEYYWITGAKEPLGLQQAKFHQGYSEQGRRYLGENTVVKVETSDGIYLWINEPQNPNFWIRMPIGDYEGNNPIELVIFTGGILFLSLTGAWILVFQMHRPLKRLAFAAREIGRGDYPGRLKETGPMEMIAVTAAFNQMAADMHQLEEDRTLLLAGISHDLRTPITRVRLASEFLSDDDAEIKAGIIADTQDMDDIIDQFIGYVRYGSEERKEKGDLAELVENVAEAASKQHVGIETEISKLPQVSFKPMAMKRVVSNLIENAFRYGKAPVLVKAYKDNGCVIISIRDHGDGIKDLDKKRLFQPFARGDKARGGKGSGLGLAIVARIIEMHKGEITINNHPEGGLEAIISLPLD